MVSSAAIIIAAYDAPTTKLMRTTTRTGLESSHLQYLEPGSRRPPLHASLLTKDLEFDVEEMRDCVSEPETMLDSITTTQETYSLMLQASSLHYYYKV